MIGIRFGTGFGNAALQHSGQHPASQRLTAGLFLEIACESFHKVGVVRGRVEVREAGRVGDWWVGGSDAERRATIKK